MLLGDFDDVDKYMVDARQLFTNIHDLKEIDEFYLTEEQIEIVKRFWGHLFFLPPKAIINSNSFNCGKFFSIFIPDYEMSYPLETKPMKAWYSETSPNGVNGKKLSTYLIHKWYSSDSTLSPKPKNIHGIFTRHRHRRFLLGLLRSHLAGFIQQSGILS